jgi:hypothetical protein
MTERIWDKFLTERDRQVFAAAGYGAPQGFGKRPVPVIVDVNCCSRKPRFRRGSRRRRWSIGARAVVDYDLLAQGPGHRAGDDAPDHVGRASRRKGHDEAHRLARVLAIRKTGCDQLRREQSRHHGDLIHGASSADCVRSRELLRAMNGAKRPFDRA